MSKNTGTSELINYFTLGASGAVDIGGNLTLSTIANATVDTDKFLVSDTGIIKYRTGAELLSDIGAQGALTNPVTGTGTAGQVTYWSSSSAITGTSNFLFDASQRNLTIDRSLSTLGNAITISKGSDSDQAWLAFKQGGGASGTWRLGYTGDPYDFRINVGSDSSIGTQALRIFLATQNVLIGTGTGDAGFKLDVGGTGRFISSGGYFSIDSNGQVTSTQSLDVATAGGRFTGMSSRGALGAIHIEQTTTGVNGGYMAFRTSDSGSTTPTEKMRITGSIVNVVGNGSQLLFDSLGSTKDGGIQYINDFTLQIYNSRGVGSAIYLGNNNLDLNISPSSNPRLRITSGGNVLIGTTTDAGFKLDVNGTGRFTSIVTSVGLISSSTVRPSSNFAADLGTSSFRWADIFGFSLNVTGISTSQQTNISADGAGVVLQGYVDNNLRIAVRGSGYNSGSRGGLLASTGDFSGSVGAGGGAVYSNLESSSATFGSTVPLMSLAIKDGTYNPRTTISYRTQVGSAYSVVFDSSYSSGWAATNYCFASGNVGIGTINPDGQLSGTKGLSIVNATNAALGLSNGTNHWLNYLSGTTYRIWNNSVAEVMTLTYGGNVLIGTTTDSGYKFFVNGASYLDGYNYASSIQYTRAVSNTVNPAGGNGVLIFSGGQSVMRMNSAYTMNFDMFNGGSPFTALQIRQNGNTVQVNSPNNSLCLALAFGGAEYGYLGGTSGNSGSLLAYSINGGYVYLSSSSTWIAASDRNRKKNFEIYNKGLTEICNLQPTLFNLKTQSDDEPKIAGLIAQEVGEHLKEAFSDGEFIGIDYSVLTVTIINAIKELNEKINKLS